MVIFHSYVKLLEGNGIESIWWHWLAEKQKIVPQPGSTWQNPLVIQPRMEWKSPVCKWCSPVSFPKGIWKYMEYVFAMFAFQYSRSGGLFQCRQKVLPFGPCISWRAISVKELCPGSWLVGGWAPRGGWRMWKPTSCMCIPVSKWLITSNNHLVGGIPTPLKNMKIHPFLICKPSINGPFPSISHGYVWNHLDPLDPAPTRKTVVLSGDISTLYRKIWEGITYRFQYIYILYTIYYIVDCQQLGLAEGTPNDGAFRDWGFHPGPFRWPKSFIRNLAVAWWFMDPLQSYHLVI